MALFSSLIHLTAGSSSAENTGHTTASLTASNDVAIARAQETIASSIFPLEVAIVVLGCLVITGFVLLMRESGIEKRSS